MATVIIMALDLGELENIYGKKLQIGLAKGGERELQATARRLMGSGSGDRTGHRAHSPLAQEYCNEQNFHALGHLGER
ncbi:MAG: hypothetical protein LBF49_00905 [Puniceicoccales bacterium]|jgi:hypothetical protein|nr:hypothetical protein [Puniceicoccales bacterium]